MNIWMDLWQLHSIAFSQKGIAESKGKNICKAGWDSMKTPNPNGSEKSHRRLCRLPTGRKGTWEGHPRDPLISNVFNHWNWFPKTCTCQNIFINAEEAALAIRTADGDHTGLHTTASFKRVMGTRKKCNHLQSPSLRPHSEAPIDLLWFLIKFWNYTKSEEQLFNRNEKPVNH